jgi:large subunit ribosomal protein L13
MKDTFITSKESLQSQWFILDAKEKCLGRLATEAVNLLRGKRKNFYNPAQDTGDYVVIINAEEIKVTGNKILQKVYMRHSGRPGGKTTESFEQLQARIPERIIEKAIKGMLPKNRLGRRLFTKLKVYAGNSHPHIAQIPKTI